MRSHLQRTTLSASFALALAALAVGLTAPVSATPPPDPVTCEEAAAADLLPLPPTVNRVTLCHFTGSDGNPFVINQPSISSADNHEGHHGDCVRFFNGTITCGL